MALVTAVILPALAQTPNDSNAETRYHQSISIMTPGNHRNNDRRSKHHGNKPRADR